MKVKIIQRRGTIKINKKNLNLEKEEQQKLKNIKNELQL